VRIAILGTGVVGRTLAGGLEATGHDIAVGTRDPRVTLARTGTDRMGTPPFAVWQEEHPDVALLPYPDAAAHGDVVVLATAGDGALAAVEAAGRHALAGKVLIDVTNPLDFSEGFPPLLSVSNTDSQAERIQRAVPDARVVKTLNTVMAGLMVDPASVAGGDHSVFVSGDDADAKATVTSLLHELGWRDVIDLGELRCSRGPEMYLPLWLRLMGALGTPAFGIKIAR
jgi:predicted dinucleotide-binding enzyme